MRGTPAVSEAVDRVALVATLLALLMYGIDGDYEIADPMHFLGLLLALGGLAALITRQTWTAPFALFAVLAAGLREHAIQGDHRASDVMFATNEAIRALLAGANPYTHIYETTNPPGSLFGYPPGEVVFYALAHLANQNIFRVDLTCGILILGLIGALAPFSGTGLAAFGISLIGWSGFVTHRLTDGSNDNAAAFLVLSAFTALIWSRAARGRGAAVLWWISAVGFGWSLAFKEYSVPIVFFVALFVWRADPVKARGWIVATLGTAAAFVIPFFAWNPAGFVHNVAGALIVHERYWGRNFWHDWSSLVPGSATLGPLVPVVLLAAIAALGIVFWRHPARAAGAALFQGVAIVAAIFVLARWTTYTYYIFLLPLLIAAAITTIGGEYAQADD